MTDISLYFTAHEVGKSETAKRLRINNQPSKELLEQASLFALEILDPFRVWCDHPVVPNSWYRCEKLEKALTKSGYASYLRVRNLRKSKDNWAKYFARKQHPKAIAADLKHKRGSTTLETFLWCRDNLDYDQLILENYVSSKPTSGWVHISWKPEGVNRFQILSF